MPNDREAAPSDPPGDDAAGNGVVGNDATSNVAASKQAASDRFWHAAGLVFAWVVVMALCQKGFTGYLLAFALLYGVLALAGAAMLARHAFRRHAGPICALGLLAAWWWIGGSYAWQRDAVLGTAAFLAVLAALPSSRLWLRRLPGGLRERWRLYRARRQYEASEAGRAERRERDRRFGEALKRGAGAFLERLRSDTGRGRAGPDGVAGPPAPPPPRPPVQPALRPRTVVLAALAVWVTLSAADRLFESQPLPRNGNVAHPPAMAVDHAQLRVGLAMSGGGYRAALVHAGVLDALGSLGIPVTHVSAVSGGSIIGAYVAVGGAPRDFLDAVIAGRFRMARDLLAAPNLLRLPSPAVVPGLGVDLWPFFGSFSRLDVQAGLIDRVLLDGATTDARPGPRLMVCMTDLNHGLSVGVTDDGVLLAGPTVKRYFRKGQAIDFPAMPRLADRVAVSGAFPGAFPALAVHARIVRDPGLGDLAGHGMDLPLQLADGGVRDNLGLELLQAVDSLARDPKADPGGSEWEGFRPGADWKLDLILVSDGGKFLQAEEPAGWLGATMRAIDLSGLATGVMRPMNTSPENRLVLLSASNLIAPGPDGVVLGIGMAALRDDQYAYFRPDALDDEVVERILGLQPDPERLRAEWRTHRQRAPAQIDRRRTAAVCPAAPETAPGVDCAWWAVISQVGEDIWRTTEAFVSAPTLNDAYTAEQARMIFRFGQYLVYLQAPALKQALASAGERRRLQAD